MMGINTNDIIVLGMPVEGREFTRYFSGFPLMSTDQEVICYHKKKIVVKHWKDIGSGIEVFLCREKDNSLQIRHEEFFALCAQDGQLMIRDGVVQGMQVHIPLTADRMGKEEYYSDLVKKLWKDKYIVVQTIMQTKDFPLIQWSITDPTLLQYIVQKSSIENTGDNSIVIGSDERRNSIVKNIITWCEENNYNADLINQYDIALIACDA